MEFLLCKNIFVIIGNGVHSKRIQKILKNKKEKFEIYKPPRKNNYFDKKKFEILKKSRAVFICSPNNTHFSYLKKLRNKYIFCEKPPVTSKRQLTYLKKNNSKKIFFNYNYRFSTIGLFLSKIKDYKLGKLLYGSIISSKGLAYKKFYKDNWRSERKKCKTGVFELVSIHTIDLLNYYFGIKKVKFNILQNLSNIKDGIDTSDCRIILNDNGIVQVFSTYYGPMIKKWDIVFQNGILEINDKEIILRNPRDNFDKSGNFLPPKIRKKIIIKHKKDYDLSLYNSVNYFLRIIKKNKKFPIKDYNVSLDSNKMVI